MWLRLLALISVGSASLEQCNIENDIEITCGLEEAKVGVLSFVIYFVRKLYNVKFVFYSKLLTWHNIPDKVYFKSSCQFDAATHVIMLQEKCRVETSQLSNYELDLYKLDGECYQYDSSGVF